MAALAVNGPGPPLAAHAKEPGCPQAVRLLCFDGWLETWRAGRSYTRRSRLA